jgi:hypothetical protein
MALIIMALVVVCVTAYLLLDPKFRPPRKEDRQGQPLSPADNVITLD